MIYNAQTTEPVAGSEITASKHGFGADELTALAEKQLQIELDSVIVVPSVQSFSEPTEQVLRYVSSIFVQTGMLRLGIKFE